MEGGTAAVAATTTENDNKRDVRRPMNAFLIFCKRHRSIVREKNPDLDNRSVTRILGDLWANLKDDEKTVYTDLAKQYKDAFMKANPDYKWHNPEKTLTCPKTTEGVKKSPEINMLPEGSITPGKLADPCNMGGLSLLLMAGEHFEKSKAHSTSSLSSLDNSGSKATSLDALGHLGANVGSAGPGNGTTNIQTPVAHSINKGDSKLSMEVKHSTPAPVWLLDSGKQAMTGGMKREDTVVKDGTSTFNSFSMKTDAKMESCLSNLFNIKNEMKHGGSKAFGQTTENLGPVPKSLLVQATDTSKRLLAEAMKNPSGEKDCYTEILRDNFTSIENQITTGPGEVLDKKAKPSDKLEKENDSKLGEINLEKASSVDGDDSCMISCGKTVVNHIIDKLYSSDNSMAGRNVTTRSTESGDSGLTNDSDQVAESTMEMEIDSGLQGRTSVKGRSSLSESSDYRTSDEYNNNLKSIDDADGFTEIKRSRRRKISQSSSKDAESAENEEGEDLQPLRKSRRRNKGQRYQKLINDGIIQPSKERMAALQQHSPKHDSNSEDAEIVQSLYSSNILPETAVRRFRKRTTSESAKDKMLHPEVLKRYKTGDFDLEAQIATLPVCAVENMGRKRGFARQRHNSECTHATRKTSELELVTPPVFNIERVVSLPPHIKIPSPEQKSTEPVVGSRKRKARKHSITHLLPAPPSTTNNTGKGKVEPKEQLTEQNSKLDIATTEKSLVAMETKHSALAKQSDECKCGTKGKDLSTHSATEASKTKYQCDNEKENLTQGVVSNGTKLTMVSTESRAAGCHGNITVAVETKFESCDEKAVICNEKQDSGLKEDGVNQSQTVSHSDMGLKQIIHETIGNKHKEVIPTGFSSGGCTLEVEKQKVVDQSNLQIKQ